MKTNSKMNDAQRIEAWKQVTTLDEAVEEAIEHLEWAASSDPYYSDLTGAIWGMIERCHTAEREAQRNRVNEQHVLSELVTGMEEQNDKWRWLGLMRWARNLLPPDSECAHRLTAELDQHEDPTTKGVNDALEGRTTVEAIPDHIEEQNPGLRELLEKAKDHKMTPEEIEAQRQSWARQDMD